MFYEIVDLQRFSGPGCTIYSVIPKGGTETLFDEFLEEQSALHGVEVNELITRLLEIGKRHGMREHFYKPHEGRLGDNICALYIKPGGRLRLYFIKYGTDIILIGGGGYKHPRIRAWQEDAV
jgi:hypothetical protein